MFYFIYALYSYKDTQNRADFSKGKLIGVEFWTGLVYDILSTVSNFKSFESRNYKNIISVIV